MKVLFIGDNDLISRRFNGYDYHDVLFAYNIESSMLVAKKMSNSEFVNQINPSIDNFTLSILKNKLFIEADVIHLQLIHNTPFDINYLPLITRLKPTVITLHDPFFLGGHCIHFFGCTQWKYHCADCQYLDIPFKLQHDDTALRFLIKKISISNSQISAIVASNWMYNLVKQSPIWDKHNIQKLSFGINQNVFKPENTQNAKKRLGIDENSITLMFRSQDNSFKGMDILKYSLNNIHADKRITLITVGQTGLLNRYKEKYIIKEFEWVTDTVFLSHLYQATDIFLMPSVQETFGLMAAEAMCCGKMVLATANTALEYTVNHPDCGIVVEHNAEVYAKELQRLLNNEEEIKNRGKKCLEFAKNTYREDLFFSGLLNVYNNVINSYNLNLPASEKENSNLVLAQLKKYSEDEAKFFAEEVVSQKTTSSKNHKEILFNFFKNVPLSKKIRKKLQKIFSALRNH